MIGNLIASTQKPKTGASAGASVGAGVKTRTGASVGASTGATGKKPVEDEWYDGPSGWSYNATKRFVRSPSGEEYDYHGGGLPSEVEFAEVLKIDAADKIKGRAQYKAPIGPRPQARVGASAGAAMGAAPSTSTARGKVGSGVIDVIQGKTSGIMDTLGSIPGALLEQGQEAVHSLTTPVAEAIPESGMLHPSAYEALKNTRDIDQKILLSTIQNLDPTQLVKFASALTGPGGGEQAKQSVTSLVQRVAAGDEDAVVELMGMVNAASFGIAMGATGGARALVPKKTIPAGTPKRAPRVPDVAEASTKLQEFRRQNPDVDIDVKGQRAGKPIVRPRMGASVGASAGAEVGAAAQKLPPEAPQTKTSTAPGAKVEAPRPEAGLPKEGQGPSTSIALRESDKRGLLPDTPEARSDIDLAEQAEKLGYGSRQGAAALLEKSRTQELSDIENFGLGARLASIDKEMEVAGHGSRAYQELLDEAKAIRGIRGTETARALRARGVLTTYDYTPQGYVRAIEEKAGILPKTKAEGYKKQAAEYNLWKDRAEKLEQELDKLRATPQPTPRVRRSPEAFKTERKEAMNDLLKAMGRLNIGFDPTWIRPVARYVKSVVDEGSLGLRESLEIAQRELKATTGEHFTVKDLHDAYLGYRSPLVGTKRTITEEAIWARRRARQVRSEMDAELLRVGRPRGQKIGESLGGLSVEARLWNPIARLIDQGANASEAIVAASSGSIERPIANVMARVLGSDAQWSRVPIRHKAELLGRYAQDVKNAWAEATSGYGRTGPASHLAGQMDAPARAWHQLSFAAERAEAIARKKGAAFGEVLDQIRDPYLKGPLDFQAARKLNDQMKEWGDIQLLTNANVVSRGREWVKTGIRNSKGIPEAAKPLANFGVDMLTAFGKVLVNVADKSAQYSNPYYATARGIYEMLPYSKGGGLSREVRIRNFAQIAKRAGFGAAVVNLGYNLHQDPEQRNGPIGAALNALGAGKLTLPQIFGPVLVEGINKDGNRTGRVWQDEGYVAMLGGIFSALMNGYRQAQIDQSNLTEKQKAGLQRELNWAPLTDNPVASNARRIGQTVFDGRELGDTASDWIIGLYWPGGLREWARIQDAQQGVHGRRARKMFESDAGNFWQRAAAVRDAILEAGQKRFPYLQEQLPAKARVRA